MDGSVYLAYDYPVLGAFWTVMWIFLWVMWLFLLFRIIIDLFRDHEMNGWLKAAWLLFLLLIPFLGVLVYVIARGKNMGKREIKHAQEQQEAFNSYVRDAAGSSGKSTADELARLSELKAKGDLSEAEFQQAKQKLLA
ncbi:SHOCT domain-containing protein [Streptomyces sp. NBC_00249]|uniref:SHOCT domain-containing protein n=1 Tax=Streptomyces sp. NBC_00249 TaxID=2975690 RepID=UPI00225328C3|nr:SHOCT domain-containing protein [Streptomyces sp. NBC_00249]MCX5195117.1 SHOCT domain-containing protein [Streptomyces sp. NBC_00249]